GDETTSLAGRHLYAKAGLLDAPASPLPADPLRARLEDHLNTAYVPIRAFLRGGPADVRVVLTEYYESCLQGPCVPEEGVNITWGDARLNDVLQQAALARIARAPLAFARLAATHYQSLWSADKLRHPATARAL